MATQKEFERAEKRAERLKREMTIAEQQQEQMVRQVVSGVETVIGAGSAGVLAGATDSEIPGAVLTGVVVTAGFAADSPDIKALGLGMTARGAGKIGEKWGAWVRGKAKAMIATAMGDTPPEE